MTAPAVTAPAAPAVAPVSPERQVSDLQTQLIAQYGTVENALRGLVTRSIQTDTELASLRGQITDLKAKVPADGSVVLPKAEAENFAKLKALGTVDEIVAGMKERGELKGETAKTRLEKAASEAAKLAGLDPEGFAAHAVAKGLHIELKDTAVTLNGKTETKKLPFVRPAADDKAALVALSDYTNTLPAFDQRALKAVAAPTAPTGTPYIGQAPATTGGGSADLVLAFRDKIEAEKAARPNPLVPTRPALAGTPS